ncbi:MAG: hypothetical protein GY768_21880 [Planctomycetaceae bacterium]|nr:hypothetical protein [Planctomycetaceae bacterium]
MSRSKSCQSWQQWTPRGRAIVSILIAVHLLAVFAAPWSSPPPAPMLAQEVSQLLLPYQVGAYLNHGYRFFAPDPGPSHIVRYEITMPDGSQKVGRIPDPDQHWPRLLYHRHFMMTESLFSNHSRINNDPPLDLMNELEREQWSFNNLRAQNLTRLMSQGIANQLLNQYDGERVQLYLQRHEIPFPAAIQRGELELDDPSLYVDLADLGVFTGDDS